jgi:hypothetical protein
LHCGIVLLAIGIVASAALFFACYPYVLERNFGFDYLSVEADPVLRACAYDSAPDGVQCELIHQEPGFYQRVAAASEALAATFNADRAWWTAHWQDAPLSAASSALAGANRTSSGTDRR